MSKIRPYTEKDMKAVHMCAVKRKCNNQTYTIVGWNDRYIQITDFENPYYPYKYFLSFFTFIDGSPCGIEEEEK